MRLIYGTLLTTLAAGMLAGSAFADSDVKLQDRNGSFTLLRDGQPYFIQGAGGGASKEFLKQCGGNSFRTWGVGDDTQAQLDEAQRLGLTVTLGIWLGHERHGFDYQNPKMVAEQFERAKAAVTKYKNHPALLMWAVGNEMEGYKDGDDPAVWKAVNDIAQMIHELDPHHPTMTVVAEIGGKRIECINKLCPAIDVVGINSYGGGPSLASRYRAAGGVKPFVITEFGPPGTWEVGRNSRDVPIELPSTAKATAYRATYEQSILPEKGKLCLGSYVFAWGSKQEATATWFGLFLPDGERLEPIDTMAELWSGKKPANRCPQIEPLKVIGPDSVKPGGTIKVAVDVKDPENDPLKIEWKLEKDLSMYETGGDAQPIPPSFPEAIVKQGQKEVELRMPDDGGGYWLYCIVHDDHNGAAVVDVSLNVDGPASTPKPPKAALPLTLYADGQKSLPFIFSGWMGKLDAISMDENCTTNPHSGEKCMKLSFNSPDNFGGIIWQSPANDWGEKPGGFNLEGASKLTFWARGEQGGERVKFVLGVIDRDKRFYDSAKAEQEFTLTADWKEYTLDLADKDLSHIKTGFGWVVGGQGHPVTFYLDDIRYK